MTKQRKRYSADFKAKAALEVVKAHRGINEIASEYGVHPSQLVQWKRQLVESLPTIFADKRSKADQEQAEREAQLYQQIGQLKVELDWMKKKLDLSVAERRALIEPEHAQISLQRQCELLGYCTPAQFYFDPSMATF